MTKTMHSIAAACAVAVVAALLASMTACTCAPGPRHAAADDMALVSEALGRSPTFSAIVRQSPRASFMVDQSTPEHFTRRETLRVHRDGAVDRLVVDASGDERWVNESPAR